MKFVLTPTHSQSPLPRGWCLHQFFLHYFLVEKCQFAAKRRNFFTIFFTLFDEKRKIGFYTTFFRFFWQVSFDHDTRTGIISHHVSSPLFMNLNYSKIIKNFLVFFAKSANFNLRINQIFLPVSIV